MRPKCLMCPSGACDRPAHLSDRSCRAAIPASPEARRTARSPEHTGAISFSAKKEKITHVTGEFGGPGERPARSRSPDEARDLLRDIVSRRTRTLGASHEDTLNGKLTLAGTLRGSPRPAGRPGRDEVPPRRHRRRDLAPGRRAAGIPQHARSTSSAGRRTHPDAGPAAAMTADGAGRIPVVAQGRSTSGMMVSGLKITL